MNKEKCNAGCQNFHGGEVLHMRDCPFYKESLQKTRDEADEKALLALKEAVAMLDKYVNLGMPIFELEQSIIDILPKLKSASKSLKRIIKTCNPFNPLKDNERLGID